MKDKDYEISLKKLDCCQNCIHFSLGMHWDGCPKGWCYQGELKIREREDVCDKYKRCIENETNTIYEDFLKDIDQEPISEMREIKEGWL